MDHVGLICRDAGDAAALLAVFDPSVAAVEMSGPPRILAAIDLRDDIAGSDVRATIDAAIARLAGAGAGVVHRALPAAFDEVEACWETLCAYEAHASLAVALRDQPVGPLLARLIEHGATIDAAAYRAAQVHRATLRSTFDGVLAATDVIALPAAGPVPDPSTTGSAVFLQPWTLFGNPAISLPAGFTADGMPVGLQLVAKRGDDARLLAIARWAEAAIGLENPGPRTRLEIAR
jgi:Asp-tRNA(Asn)/Glu-tRNA(Gln) amidotransferase A subunit family amidase